MQNSQGGLNSRPDMMKVGELKVAPKKLSNLNIGRKTGFKKGKDLSTWVNIKTLGVEHKINTSSTDTKLQNKKLSSKNI